MDFEKLCLIGVRQQNKAVYRNWAREQLLKSCAVCTEQCTPTCECEKCPIFLAHQEAMDRIVDKTEVSLTTKPTPTVVPTMDMVGTHLQEMHLPERTRCALQKANITNASEIQEMSDEDILAIPGIGKTGLAAIRGQTGGEVVQPGKRGYNRTLTVTVCSADYSADEWKILSLLLKRARK